MQGNKKVRWQVEEEHGGRGTAGWWDLQADHWRQVAARRVIVEGRWRLKGVHWGDKHTEPEGQWTPGVHRGADGEAQRKINEDNSDKVLISGGNFRPLNSGDNRKLWRKSLPVKLSWTLSELHLCGEQLTHGWISEDRLCQKGNENTTTHHAYDCMNV